MNLLLAILGVFIILVASEFLWRKKIIRGETARKFVHILVGSFVAFWPYFLSWQQIQLMSLAFLVVVIISWQKNIFHAVHQVQRKTWGELFFPIGIGLSAVIAPEPLIFTAAILHLSLADGLAAVVGKKYGLLHQYKIGNYTKTLMGTLTFWFTSTLIIFATLLISSSDSQWSMIPIIVWLPLTATLIENVAVMGTDNLFVPLLIVGVLGALGVS